MCGIVGFINRKNDKQIIIENMMNRIIHRGPDSEGKYIDDNVALGFRRLSIMDVECGTQPIYNEDNSKLIIFNGEVYNFQELREDLISKGHQFKTHADTEVVLHGYEEYGSDICSKLRGMYAFAIWDIKKQELFGARDSFGIKPYYYAEMNGTFMFGSEIKSFLEHPDFHKEVNKEALKPYMTFQYSALPETFFKGVYRIPEGHYFYYKDGKLTIKQYFDAKYNSQNMSLDDSVDLIDKTVCESIKSHSVTDEKVKVGSFLSSGVDSSYVVSVLKPDNTFSVGFGDHTYNESQEAKRLTDELGLINTSKVVDGDEAFDTFPMIQYYLDEPDSNPSCVPLYFLSKLASEHVKVVLSGEGADELFAGYTDYGFNSNSKVIRVVAEGLKKLPKNVRYKIAHSIKGKHFHGQLHLYNSLAPAQEVFIGQAKVFDEEETLNYLTPEYQSSPSVQEIVDLTYEKVIDNDEMTEIQKKQYLDIHQWMPGDILLKADKLSMANSIELRVPLLDTEVLKTAEKIPSKYLINQHNTKYAFRKAANRHLPVEWAQRPKLGFPVPIKDWLLEEKYYLKVRELFNQDFVSEFFVKDKIIKMLDENYKGEVDSRRKIWTIYTFLTWYKVFFIDQASN